MDQEINILALTKGQEHYVFLYDDRYRTETLRTFRRFAADPQLSFTWYDAAVLSKKLRDVSPESGDKPGDDLPGPLRSLPSRLSQGESE